MKKLFMALCDILAFSMGIAWIAMITWGLSVLIGWPVAEIAKNVFIVAAIVLVIDATASYCIWDEDLEDELDNDDR